VAKNRAVTITVGGTIITDIMALLVLAVVIGFASGDLSQEFWLQLSLSFLLFVSIVIFVFPVVTRWFFKHFDDSITQYIFILAMLFLAAFLAEVAGVEPIIGAFLAGLSLNKLIPRTSPLMSRIEFVGNALFIPFFLIGVGMLVDYHAFIKSWDTLWVAGIITSVAIFSKFVAAWFTQKTFRFSANERRLIFGLSGASAAATLAIVKVGYDKELLNESVLNGTIVAILVSCTVASFIAQRGARKIALLEADSIDDEKEESFEKIMVAVDNDEMAEELVKLALIIKSKSNKKSLFALNIVDNDNSNAATDKHAKKVLDKAAVTAAAADVYLNELIR
jgi:Kef-type K+ transport system membrane component KefB